MPSRLRTLLAGLFCLQFFGVTIAGELPPDPAALGLEPNPYPIEPCSKVFLISCSPAIMADTTFYNEAWFHELQNALLDSDSTNSYDLFPKLEDYFLLDGVDAAAAYDSIYISWTPLDAYNSKIRLYLYEYGTEEACSGYGNWANCAGTAAAYVHVYPDSSAYKSVYHFGMVHELAHEMNYANEAYRDDGNDHKHDIIGWIDEFFATSGEILFSLPNWPYEVNPPNTFYDHAINDYSAYNQWRLFSAYIDAQHRGNAGDITDDLLYRWIRSTNDSTRLHFSGLAEELSSGDYGVPGASGVDKLARLFNRYALAKYADDNAYAGGLYGFGDYSPRTRPFFLFEWVTPEPNSPLVRIEPPHFEVDPSNASITTSTYNAPGGACSIRNLGMRKWTSEYLVFHASEGFPDRDLELSIRSGDILPDSTEVRIGYLLYDAIDSVLYDDALVSVVESLQVVLDGDTLKTSFTIEDFGTTYKSAVLVVSLVGNPPKPFLDSCDDGECPSSSACGEFVSLEVTYDIVGQTIPFPGAHGSLQEAVDAGAPGDTVLIESNATYSNLVINSPILLMPGELYTPAIHTSSSSAACTINADNVAISGIAFRDNPTTAIQSVVVNNGVGTVLEDCSVVPYGQGLSVAIEGHYGLTLINCDLEADSWGVRSLSAPLNPSPEGTTFIMEGCVLTGCGVELEEGVDSILDDIEIIQATTGVKYAGSIGAGTLSNSTITECTTGVEVNDIAEASLTLAGLSVVNSVAGIAILNDASSNLIINGNTVTGNSAGTTGIQLSVSTGAPQLTANTISGYSAGSGMLLSSGSGTIETNTIHSCKYGFDITSSSQVQLGDPSNSDSDNVVYNNSSYGIKVGSSSDLLAHNNEIYGNNTGVIFVNGSSGNLGDMIQDGLNSIYSNTRFCIDNRNTTGSIPAYGNWWGGCFGPTCTIGSVLYGTWLCYQPASGNNVPIEQLGALPSAILSVSPNPTETYSSMRYRLASPVQDLVVEVFDVQGRRVRTMLVDDLQAGVHELTWDLRTDSGASVRSGVYWMRVLADRALLDTKQVVVTMASQEEE